MKKIKQSIKEYWKEIMVVMVLLIAAIVSVCTQCDEKGKWWWNLLNNINIIVGFVTAIIAYLTWRATKVLRGDFEKETRIAQNRDSLHSVAISISCGNDISNGVKAFLNSEDKTKTIYNKLISNEILKGAEVFKKKYSSGDVLVNVDAHYISLSLKNMPEDEGELGDYMREYSTVLEDICGLCKANNISNIYLFIGGPMPIAFLAGEKFANKFLIYTHHHIPSGGYVMTTCRSFRDYVDNSRLFDFSNI